MVGVGVFTELTLVKIGPLCVHIACVKTFDSQPFGVSCDSRSVLVLCVQKKSPFCFNRSRRGVLYDVARTIVSSLISSN